MEFNTLVIDLASLEVVKKLEDGAGLRCILVLLLRCGFFNGRVNFLHEVISEVYRCPIVFSYLSSCSIEQLKVARLMACSRPGLGLKLI